MIDTLMDSCDVQINIDMFAGARFFSPNAIGTRLPLRFQKVSNASTHAAMPCVYRRVALLTTVTQHEKRPACTCLDFHSCVVNCRSPFSIKGNKQGHYIIHYIPQQLPFVGLTTTRYNITPLKTERERGRGESEFSHALDIITPSLSQSHDSAWK